MKWLLGFCAMLLVFGRAEADGYTPHPFPLRGLGSVSVSVTIEGSASIPDLTKSAIESFVKAKLRTAGIKVVNDPSAPVLYVYANSDSAAPNTPMDVIHLELSIRELAKLDRLGAKRSLSRPG